MTGGGGEKEEEEEEGEEDEEGEEEEFGNSNFAPVDLERESNNYWQKSRALIISKIDSLLC